MRKLTWMSGVLLAAWGLLPAQTLGAQAQSRDQSQGRPSTMSTMAHCPMMAAVTRGPDAVLSSRKELALTDAQVNRLETIRTTQMQATKGAMDSMMAVHKRLATLSEAPQFDESAVRRVFDRMGALHAAAGTAMLRATHDAEAALTAEQRKKLQERAGKMEATAMMHMSGMNMSGMAGDSMMHGGMQNMHRMMSMMGMPGCGMMHDSTDTGPHKH